MLYFAFFSANLMVRTFGTLCTFQMREWGFLSLYTQFTTFYYLQLERNAIEKGDQTCIFYSSYNCYVVLFWLVRRNALLLRYVFTYSLIFLLTTSVFTYLIIGNSICFWTLTGNFSKTTLRKLLLCKSEQKFLVRVTTEL